MQDETNSVAMTTHGAARANQRGFAGWRVAQLIALADTVKAVGGGCSMLTVSRAALATARADGLAAADAERLALARVILAPDGAVITMFTPHRSRRKGRHGGRPAILARARISRRVRDRR